MESQNCGIHITYEQELTLKELSEALKLINTSVNDYYRERGIRNSDVGEFAPRIKGVRNGSILLDIVFPMILNITTMDLKFIVECIKSRLEKIKESQRKQSIQNIHVEGGDNCIINVHIYNASGEEPRQ